MCKLGGRENGDRDDGNDAKNGDKHRQGTGINDGNGGRNGNEQRKGTTGSV
ncbi:MAG: hypothetical protein LBC30_00640 [Puniceicoccales bacterium]|jgi:hypothetical protein|nr:hypothetical protein [Puniceicoccales bacterium]